MEDRHFADIGPKPVVARWAPAEGEGLEHLVLSAGADGVTAEGTVIGGRFEADYALSYRVACAPGWVVREVAAQVPGGGALCLSSDGAGNWRDGDGTPLPALAGAIDVDISATPFTNTLPIRRLGLAAGERGVIRVVYIRVPELTCTLAEQAYTCLEPGRRYRYESLSSGFEAELEVDDLGLVAEYPELFTRQG